VTVDSSFIGIPCIKT